MMRFSVRNALASVVGAVTMIAIASSADAITFGQIDTFPPGTSVMGWRGNTTMNVANEGPLGVGDSALRVESVQRMITVIDFDSSNEFRPSQWTGDYTAAGVTEISMDVRNPNLFDLQLFVGISDETVSAGGSGATYVTDYSITIPADDAWHDVTFSVTADDFVASASNTEGTPVGPAAILSDVYQLRIFHATVPGAFIGDEISGHFFLNNITTGGPTPAADADFDGDDDVDGANFLTWQRQLGKGTTQPAGDADFNNAVNGLDLAIWQAQFGMGAAAPAAAAIPEPGAVGMAALAFAGAIRARRRSRRGRLLSR